MLYRSRRKRVLLAVAVIPSVFATTRAFGQFQTTWTNATGDHQWGDAGNWTGGVPTAFQLSYLPLELADVIDLGGVSRNTGSDFIFGPYSFNNGTFITGGLGVISQSGATLPLGMLNANVVNANSFGGMSVGGFDVHSQLFPGNGPLSFSGRLSSAQSFTSPIIIAGVSTFSSSAGSALNSSKTTLGSGTLTLEYAGGADTNRLPDASPIRLDLRSSLNLRNSAATDASEVAGPITFDAGESSVQLQRDGNGVMRLNVPSIAHNAHATGRLNFIGGVEIRVAATPDLIGGGGTVQTTSRSIVPWMISSTGNDNSLPDFVTFLSEGNGGAGVLEPLNLTTEAATAVSAGPSTDNVRLPTGQNISNDSTANALLLTNGVVNIAPAAHLSITSGALILSNSFATTDQTIDAFTGSGELRTAGDLIVHTESSGVGTRFAINTPIAANSLTKAGASTLVLTQPNALPGGVTINSGTLVSQVDGAVGNGTVIISDGTFAVEGESQSFGPIVTPVTADVQTQGSATSSIGFRSTNVVRVDGGLTATAVSLSGGALFTKEGNGTLRIGDSPDFLSVSTSLNAGTLEVNGRLGASASTFASTSIHGPAIGASLTGDATIGARVIGLDVEPGANVGQMTVSNLSGEGILGIDIAGDSHAGTDYDQLVSIGASSLLNRSLVVRLENGYVPTIGQTFDIVDIEYIGVFTEDTFLNLPQNAVFTVDGSNFQITYTGGADGHDVVLTAVVPEPATGCIFLAAASIACARRRRARGG